MNTYSGISLVDKMQKIKQLQTAAHGAKIEPSQDGKTGFAKGGNWEIVTKFKGKSHENGGIDIEVNDGYVRRVSGVYDPDDIAKNGRVWKDIGAAAYGAGEGLLDTLSMGATDQLTDWGYKSLQKVGKSTEDEKREQDSIRGYGITAGAITGGVVSGGATTGAAIQQGSKGLGMGISKGSPDSKLAQQIGVWLPVAGQIGGMVAGNAGYAQGSDMAKFANYAQMGGKAFNMVQNTYTGMQNMPASMPRENMGASLMPMIGGMMSGGYQGEVADKGKQYLVGSKESFGGGGDGGMAQAGDIFYNQVPMREDTLAYLAKYSVNV
jgi:hypothetical protein